MDGCYVLVLTVAFHPLYYSNAEAIKKTLEVLEQNVKGLQDEFNEKLGHHSNLNHRMSYAENKLFSIMNSKTENLEGVENAEKYLSLVQVDERMTQRRIDTLERRLMLLQKSEYSLLKRVQRVDQRKDGLNYNDADQNENNVFKRLMKTDKSPDACIRTGGRKQV